jgi:hypothetical protein
VNPTAGISVCQGVTYRPWVDSGAAGTVTDGDRAGRRVCAPSRPGPDRTGPDRTDPGNRTVAEANGVLADSERRVAEHRMYRALVDRANGVARDHWAKAVPELRSAWEKIKEKYGYEEQQEPAPQADGGAWHGKGGRTLDAAQNEEIDRGYARIREAGEKTIIPGILSVEAEDPTRCLAGFDKRFKGEDRLKEKIADRIRSKGHTPEEALARLPDVVRCTYEYGETTYTADVQKDMQRLEAEGSLSWNAVIPGTMTSTGASIPDGEKPESGVMFEVQFHTHASLEAKELTHNAYERVRSITEQTPESALVGHS